MEGRQLRAVRDDTGCVTQPLQAAPPLAARAMHGRRQSEAVNRQRPVAAACSTMARRVIAPNGKLRPAHRTVATTPGCSIWAGGMKMSRYTRQSRNGNPTLEPAECLGSVANARDQAQTRLTLRPRYRPLHLMMRRQSAQDIVQETVGGFGEVWIHPVLPLAPPEPSNGFGNVGNQPARSHR